MVYQSRNGDFAEWMRRLPDEPAFEAGDVIGFDQSSRLTRRATGASQVSRGAPETSARATLTACTMLLSLGRPRI